MSATARKAEDRTTLDAACMLAMRNLHVIPIEPRGKKPAIENWQTDGSTDLPQLHRWFANGHADRNLGVVCGLSRIVVVDRDPRNGGDETFARLERELGALPPTVTADTGGDGSHHVFLEPVGVDLVSKLGPGVDLLHGGRQILVEPSVHPSGKPYRWRAGCAPGEIAIADLPPAWIERATRKVAEPSPLREVTGDHDQRVNRARAYAAKMPPSISGSGGHDALWNVTCRLMHGFGLDESITRDILRADFNPRCDPAWSDREIDHKIESAREQADVAKWRVDERESPRQTPRGSKKSDPSATGTHESKERKASKAGPVGLAQQYVRKVATHADGVALRRWRGDWYRWFADRGYYASVSDEGIDASLYRELDLDRRQDVGDVRHALLAVDDVLIDEVDLGSWLGRSDVVHDPLDIAACPNGLLHLPSRTIAPASPRYFATTALGVAYESQSARPSRWIAFLEQLWDGDPESIAALQEWFGYLLTADTRQQKILLLVGPKRSGKGTIMRVLTALLGRASIAAPTLASLGTNFGLWPLIGKTAAIIGDARLGGRSDIAQIVERLLSVSGQDPQTIDRKHREPWTGYLSSRITIVSNELPRFTDAADALTSRMLILELGRSWYGQEDVGLTDALIAELPGILLWAIDGWERLRDRGHFVQPRSSADTVIELGDLASPVGAWVRECCDVGPHKTLLCDLAYSEFKEWCKANGHEHVPTLTTFGRDLKAATGARRERETTGARTRFYDGVTLKRPVRL